MKISQLLENQKDVIKLLTNSKQKDKLVHAYIFEGEDGVGRAWLRGRVEGYPPNSRRYGACDCSFTQER